MDMATTKAFKRSGTKLMSEIFRDQTACVSRRSQEDGFSKREEDKVEDSYKRTVGIKPLWALELR